MPLMSVSKLACIIRAIQLSNHDFPIAISGNRGMGKSTLMIQLAKELFPGYFNMREHLIYSRKILLTKLKESPKFEPVCVDEAISNIFKREWHQKQQIRIVELLNMYRDQFYVIFFCIPHFWDVDSSIRNSLILKLWIHVYKRGEGIVFTSADNPFTKDPWNQNYNFTIWKRIWKSSNYLTNISWSDLPERESQEYIKIKAEKRSEYDQETNTNPKLTKKELIIALKNNNPDLSNSMIAEVLNADRKYVYTSLK